MDLTMSLFPVRHGISGGLASAIYNLTKGLVESGVNLTAAHSDPGLLAPEFRAWLSREKVATRRYPSFGLGTWARFLEESLFALQDRSRRVIYPNYFLPVRVHPAVTGVLVHDLLFREFPEYFSWTKRKWLYAQHKRAFAKADLIFFISAFEREQARRFYGTGFDERAVVIYNSIDWSRYEGGKVSDDIRAMTRQPYVLTVAQQYPHKNIETLISAFALFGAKHREFSLILAGRRSPAVEAAAALLAPAIRQRIHLTGFVSDADLGHLYRETALFALPSLYEGFGMPAVEALGFGKPVLVADAGAQREVTMGKADYLPREASPGQWSERMESLATQSWSPRAGLDELRARYHPTAVARLVIAAFGKG